MLVRTGDVQASCDRRTVIGMDLSHPFPAAERLCWAKTQDFRRILTQPYQAGAKVPIKGYHAASPKRFLQPMLSFEDREFVCPSLAEQSRENKRAERSGQNGRLSRQDTLIERQMCIAEKANGKYRGPHDRDCAHERCNGCKGRANTGGDPHEQRTERGARSFELPRLVGEERR